MYPEHSLEKKATVGIEDLRSLSVADYIETPKLITIVMHAEQEDDTEFFCVEILKTIDPDSQQEVLVWRKKIFFVPRQNVSSCYDKAYGAFICVQVIDPEEKNQIFWLISSGVERRGFLLPLNYFSPPLKQRIKKPRHISRQTKRPQPNHETVL